MKDTHTLALAGTDTTDANQPSHPQEAANLESCKDDSPGFTTYWKQYLAAVERAESSIAAIRDSSKSVFGLQYAVGENFSGWKLLRTTRSELIEAIVRKAEIDFAPPGGSLAIKTRTVDETWARADDAEFDPDRLWVALEATYGGNAGVELGRKQLATEIVKHFGLGRKRPVRKANRLELASSIYTEHKYGGGVEMGYTTANWVCELHRAMSAFCRWAGDSATAAQIESRATELFRDRTVVSRQRFNFGGIGYVTFNTSMTWEIYGELGDQFQAFVATYGQDALGQYRD